MTRRSMAELEAKLDEGELHPSVGLVGDTWIDRGSKRTEDGSSQPDMQLNVMNARVISYIAGDPERIALAGYQLYLDLDVTEENLPAGTRLALGTAVIEVTEQPHRGCAKFADRFGLDALRFVNAPHLRGKRLRGLNAKVVTPGIVRSGDKVTKIS